MTSCSRNIICAFPSVTFVHCVRKIAFVTLKARYVSGDSFRSYSIRAEGRTFVFALSVYDAFLQAHVVVLRVMLAVLSKVIYLSTAYT